ncbi:MAG: VOC family protein [Gemmatimonadota bacterium]|nr:VOC family protein [Gemmatimonadota bacterium]
MSGTGLETKDIWSAITVNDIQKSLAFYVDGLGFSVVEEMKNEDGNVRFAMLSAGEAKFGIGQDDWAKGKDRKKGVGLRFWAGTTRDIHALAARAEAAGITLDSKVEPLPWGPLAFAVTDPDGFALTIVSEG